MLVFLWQSMSVGQSAAASFAIVPAELFQVQRLRRAGARALRQRCAVPEGVTLLTYMFLHGDILHLLSNMLFLWVFGDNVEDAMGHLKFLVFYLLCGMARRPCACADAAELSKLPLIGASGAVAGVIAAYLILHPRVLVWVLAFRFIPLRISAAWVLGVWVATQFAHGAAQPVRPGRLVGAHRRHGCGRRPDRVHAPAGRAAVRPRTNPGLTLQRRYRRWRLSVRFCGLCATWGAAQVLVQSAAPSCPIDTQLSRPYAPFRTCERSRPAVIELDTK